MGDLTKDFSKKEFACKCCGEIRINQKLIIALQVLREMIKLPIHILSGYRCPKHNAEVGGKAYSQHLLGTAADITIEGMLISDVAYIADKIPVFHNGGIGTYVKQNFVHVDVRNGRARWKE